MMTQILLVCTIATGKEERYSCGVSQVNNLRFLQESMLVMVILINSLQRRLPAGMKKIQDVEELVEKLQSKHGAKYSVEQFKAWANLIHLKKHSSEDKPPELPYFTGRTSWRKKRTADEFRNPVGDS